MKSRTSFSKLTPFKKDITRFAPIWALYLIGILLVLMQETGYYGYSQLARELPGFIMAFGIVNLIYAAICAVMLYGDLYNTRMCYSLHALPQRRESWLLSHFAAGMAFSLVPNCIAALLFMARLGSYGYLALYWLLASELQFLFFFGIASVSAMLTGSRFAMLLVYAGLNFVSMLAYWIVDTIYLPMLEGVVLDMTVYKLLCPVVQMFQHEYMEFERLEDFFDVYYKFIGLSDGWGYLAILGVLGLVLMGAATLLYRLRHLESAGDFVAFPKLKGVMCVVMTICVGGVFAFVGEEMLGDSMMLWLIVGLVIGYFGSLMLLERRVKVFRGKTLIGFGALAAVLVVSTLLISADVFGIIRWIPEPDQVKSVTIANYMDNEYSYYDEIYYGNRIRVKLEEPEEIEDVIEAHQDILNRLNIGSNDRHRVTITYTLKSGRVVKRSYTAPANGRNYEIFNSYFYTPNQILGTNSCGTFISSVRYAHVDGNEIPDDYRDAFLSALWADCQKGQVTLSGSSKEAECYVYLELYDVTQGQYGRELDIHSGAEETLAVLKKPAVVLGYSDLETFLSELYYVNVNGIEVKSQYYRGLMEAMEADCENGHISLLGDWYAAYTVEYSDGQDYRYIAIPKAAEKTIAYIEEHIIPE